MTSKNKALRELAMVFNI